MNKLNPNYEPDKWLIGKGFISISESEITGDMQLLYGVDRERGLLNKNKSPYNNCDVLRFNLNGKTHIAVENPDDGYRSSLGDILTTEESIINPFHSPIPVKVICKRTTVKDFVLIKNTNTNKTIIVFGTKWERGYCPMCIMKYYPENLGL